MLVSVEPAAWLELGFFSDPSCFSLEVAAFVDGVKTLDAIFQGRDDIDWGIFSKVIGRTWSRENHEDKFPDLERNRISKFSLVFVLFYIQCW